MGDTSFVGSPEPKKKKKLYLFNVLGQVVCGMGP